SANGKVYYMPAKGEDPNSEPVFAPKLYELVRFQGDEEEDGWQRQVEYVTLRELNFMYSDRVPETEYDPEWLTRNAESPDGMIFMEGVKHCSVEKCVLGYSGAQGIVLNHYAQECRIVGNEIAQSSSGGVFLTGYGPGTTDLNKNHYIAKNHIHNIGLDYMHSCAVQMYGSNNNTVEFNYFHDLPYAAVSIIGMAWSQMKEGPGYRDTINAYGENATMYNPRWDEIDRSTIKTYTDSHKYMHSEKNVTQYNIIDDYMQNMRDGGSLYCWCSGGDKVWQYNVGSREFTDDWAVRAIHMDDYDGLNYIYNNLFHAKGATDNSHTNGTEGGRGDGGKTDLDVWDDTLSDNTWKENIITPYEFPEGYLELRAYIAKTAGEWICRLPGAVKETPDSVIAGATVALDASDTEAKNGEKAGLWKSKTGGYTAVQDDGEAMPSVVEYAEYKTLRFENGKSLTLKDIDGLNGTDGLTVVVVSRDMENDEDDASSLLRISGNDGKNGIVVGSYQNSVKAGTTVGANSGTFIATDREAPEPGFTSTVFVKNGAEKHIYIDGTEAVSAEDEEFILTGDKAEITVGDFNGEITELFVFARALTENEINIVCEYLKDKYFTVEEPVIEYEFDENAETSSVTINCETPGATVYYTLDRSEPTVNSTKYEGTFTVEGTAVIRCVALKDGWSDSRNVSKVIGVSAKVPTENLLLHLDAADAPVEAGSKVDELKSRVNDYVAKQSNAGNKPTLIELDGFYALSFDGDDMMIVNDFLNLEGHTGFTLAAVSRSNESNAGGDGWCNRQSLIMINESGGYGAIFVGSYREDIRARIGIGTGTNFESYTVSVKRNEPNDGFTSTIFVKDGKTQSVYADGELIFSEDNGREKISNTSNTELRIGTGITGFNGDIAELLIYDSALTEEQIASLNRYFESKYFGGNSDN
ncbi:MAG: chitobiase/beta-hexosaminidase C-terminal domain-containing protein, partial [Clostridia bacterium]|nr:chitobiase/beta-hexosaminidase C-terminal domain-containing protein [Clostridia bacterium]